MDIHYGEVVEKVVRRNGYSITKIAKFMKVNRRSVYYWFKQKYLKANIIYNIGLCIKYDFSADFPHLFEESKIKSINTPQPYEDLLETTNSSIWKDKYIGLLEEYNESLLIRSKKKGQ